MNNYLSFELPPNHPSSSRPRKGSTTWGSGCGWRKSNFGERERRKKCKKRKIMTLCFYFLSSKEKLLETKTMNGFERITSVKDMAMRDRIDKGMKLVSEKVRKEIYFM